MEKRKEKPLRMLVNGINYYTFDGAIEELKISESTLKREINGRRIRYFRHTSGKLFEKEWLDEWQLRRTVQPLKKLKLQV